VVIAAAPIAPTPPQSSPAPGGGGGGGGGGSSPTITPPSVIQPVVPKQEVSIITGVTQTQKNLSGYFGNIQQSIALKS
jgi:hypothetical protein